jgi:hypothetical protein
MEGRLRDVAKVWGVTPETAAKILAGREWQDFWKSVNADEFLNLRLAMPGDEYQICRGCSGTGMVYAGWEDGEGTPCRDCDGRGFYLLEQ